MRLLLTANNQATRRNKIIKSYLQLGSSSPRYAPCLPNKKQIHLQNSFLQRTQFWIRKTFSKPASRKGSPSSSHLNCVEVQAQRMKNQGLGWVIRCMACRIITNHDTPYSRRKSPHSQTLVPKANGRLFAENWGERTFGDDNTHTATYI
jgi:hypothetical protein